MRYVQSGNLDVRLSIARTDSVPQLAARQVIKTGV
jgi:hypothetical protein